LSKHPHYVRRAASCARSLLKLSERLWSHLSRGQLKAGNFAVSARSALYFADFLCAEARLIIEVDGGQHGGQRAMR